MPLNEVEVRNNDKLFLDVLFVFFLLSIFSFSFNLVVRLCSFANFNLAYFFFAFQWPPSLYELKLTYRFLSHLQYQTVLQTNPDGTFSLIQVDPSTLSNNPSIITLPDGTTAQVQGVATVSKRNDHHHLFIILFEHMSLFLCNSFTRRATEQLCTPCKLSTASQKTCKWTFLRRSLKTASW
jgi:hypothetical protein